MTTQELQPTSNEWTGQGLLLRKIDLLLLTGEMLMESGADTTRIMRTLKRVMAFFNFSEDNLQTYVNFNMLMVNWSEKGRTFTKFRRIKKHGIDMTAISRISLLSCKIGNEYYTIDQYEQELKNIKSEARHYTPWQVALGGGLACGGFCIQFGGDWTAFLYSSIAAVVGLRLRLWLNHQNGSNPYINVALSTFGATLMAWLTAYISLSSPISAFLPPLLKSVTPWHPLLACALFVVPGVPLINFVSDLIAGHTQTGIIRAINTLVIIFSMAFGIALAVKVFGIDNFVHDLSMTPHHNYITFAIAAAISAVGFSMIFNTPPRLLWVVALGGIIAVCSRNFVNLGASNQNIGLDMGLAVGSLAGSVLISLIVTRIIHSLHTPHQCLSIPSVIPMIPGVLMYRSLFALIGIHNSVNDITLGINNGVHASLVILCIATGVAIPNIFMRRLIAPKPAKGNHGTNVKPMLTSLSGILNRQKAILLKAKKLDRVFQNLL